MYVELENNKLELTDNGISSAQDNLNLTFNSDLSLDTVETLFKGDTSTLSVLDDGGTEVNLFSGYTNLLSVSKDVSNNTITVGLGRPSITIRGLSNIEEVKTILESQGYSIE